MTAPTDEKLIAQGPPQKGVREMGSLIEERIHADEKARGGFRLGHVKRTCDVCHKDWIGPAYCGQGTCRGLTFTERDVRPSPTMTLLGRGVTAVEEPSRPKLIAALIDVDALRELRAALVETEAKLVRADAAARRLVNVNVSNFECFSHIQEVLNLMSTPGDFEIVVGNPLKAVGLRQIVHALIAEIDVAIQRYETEAVKK
jgi:hypothetical protein